MPTIVDRKNRFVSQFNSDTGFYVRTGVLDAEGKDTGVDPFMANYPELLDIGIMGYCEHGINGLCVQSGVKCYQSGLHKKQPHMSLEDFKRIIDECKGKTYQVALGGRGDVNKHPQYKEFVQYARENGIVPNFTTSGLALNYTEVNIAKEFCGSIAASWYRQEHTLKALDMLISAGVKTNIHYVLGNFSIDEAIEKLEDLTFPDGINAVIFLLHKPVGMATQADVLQPDDPKVHRFFELVDKGDYPFKIGFDSCSVPGVLNFTKDIHLDSIDTCEGARWSMYITPDCVALPCSFDQEHKWGFDLKGSSIKEAWDSEQFEDFRSRMRNSCSGCSVHQHCRSGCPIKQEIVLCNREERK